MMKARDSHLRRVLSLVLLAVCCGVALVPRTAHAGYCVYRVITTRITSGDLTMVIEKWELQYCCPGDARCG